MMQCPKPAPGDLIAYLDHQDRLQSGKIVAVEIRWVEMRGEVISIENLTVTHPTYKSGRAHISRDRIK